MEFDNSAVLSQFGIILNRGKQLEQKAVEVKESVQEVASFFSVSDGQIEELGALRDSLKDIVLAQKEMSAYLEALKHAQQTYTPTDQPSNFKTHLHDRTADLFKSFGFDPETAPDIVEFEAATGLKQSEKGEDDLEIQITNAEEVFVNMTCPLTQKHIFELNDPVEDAKGVIYERQAVQQYITQHRGQVSCPLHGRNHYVTMKELKTSKKVLREKKKARFQQTQTEPQVDVLDV